MIKNLLQPSKIIALNDGQPEVFGHQMQGKCSFERLKGKHDWKSKTTSDIGG